MLAANMAVAALLADAFSDIALLRRHPPPLERKMAELGALSEKLGLELDVSGAAALQASLQVRVRLMFGAQGFRRQEMAQLGEKLTVDEQHALTVGWVPYQV